MDILLEAGEVYLVGGWLRDWFLSHKSNDFDLAIRGKGIPFAKHFAERTGGKLIVLSEDKDEARVVLKDFTFDFNGIKDISSDLKRRDFTMNSIAIRPPYSRIIDPFEGRRDIRRKTIRMVSPLAFKQDPLRILRGFRFKSCLNFCIDRRTLLAMKNYRAWLADVAGERISHELFLLLSSPHSWKTLEVMSRIRVLDNIFNGTQAMRNIPQNKPFGDLMDHSIQTVRMLEEMDIDSLPYASIFKNYIKKRNPILKLACLLHDIGKPKTYGIVKNRVHFYGHEKTGVEMASKLAKKLKLSNIEIRVLAILILNHMRPHLLASDKYYTQKAIWRLVRDMREETPGLFLLALSDALASGATNIKPLMDVIERGMNFLKKEPKRKRLITGDDLIDIGFIPGPGFRKILEDVEEKQALGVLKTSREAIIYVKNNYIDSLSRRI
jgi:poly(A) polymerase